MTGNDVFFSLAGTERDTVRRIREALERPGLRVFIDESLTPAHSITAGIEEELNASKIMLILYSAAYPHRPACQFELTAAFLAGLSEGDPLRRIMVINPEPSEQHLQPIQLADAAFVRLPKAGDDRAMKVLVDAVAEKVAAVDGTFGEISFRQSPRWYPDGAGEPAFVERYREQWDLHTALHKVDHPMVARVTGGPVVALVGLAGSGKSTLASAYAWRFGAAFPGGVFRTTLSGATAADALARYGDELRSVAVALRLHLDDDADRAEVAAAVADHIHTAGRTALWIIDDVPHGLGRDVLGQLLLPAGTVLRTIMIGREDMFGGVAPVVELGPMSTMDAVALLHRFRAPDDNSEDDLAAERIARRLGGHAFSLGLVAAQLTDRQGLRSYADELDRLDSDPAALDQATRLVGAAFAGLGDGQRLVLQVAALLAPAPVPAAVLSRIVAAARPGVNPADDLAGLRTLQLASRTADRWQFHSIVLEAVRRQLTPVEAVEDLVGTAADLLLAETETDSRTAGVAPHLAALADHDLLDVERSRRLRRRLVEHFRLQGESVPAAEQWDRLLATGDPAPAELLAAAGAHLAAGSYEQAIELASQAQHHPDGDAESAVAGDQLVAQGLDALGRLDEANERWARVASGPFTSADAELAYIRSRRLRGEMHTARQRVEDLVARLGDSEGDLLQAARIELATIQLSTNRQQEARRTAEAVVRHYAERELPGHANAVAAQSVLAQAWLTLHLFELNPDPRQWQDSARKLWETREQLRRSHGPLNAQTLTTDVEYGFALLCLGKPTRALAHLTTTLDALRRRFPGGHPLIMRATLLLGRAYAQLHDFERSRDLHQDAYDRLRVTLGPRHPETLAAQYGLGVALKMTGADGPGHRMIFEVARAAPSVVGLKTDMFGQGLAGTILLPLIPGRVLRRLGWLWSSAPKPGDET